MDGNKDESNRCIAIAITSISEGRFDKAEKFLLKAEKLYPSQKAKELLAKVKMFQANAPKEHPNTDPQPETVRRRKLSDTKPTEPEYTTEQLDAVKKINKCKDYYQVLGVSKEATDSEVKKAYKKLALLVHPDKNKAPGSAEAFKTLGNAAAVLTDAEKRKAYNLYGINEPINSHGHSSHSGMGRTYYSNDFGYARSFQADVTAEEIFNMFFGGGYPQQTFQRQRRQRAERERENTSASYALINLFPIMLLIGLSMISSFFISDPIYTLQPSHKYSVRRETNNLKIPYYVKDNFYSEYQGSVGRLEASVEEDYLNHLRQSCARERSYRDGMQAKARAFGDRDLFKKAQGIVTPSCDNLQRFLSV